MAPALHCLTFSLIRGKPKAMLCYLGTGRRRYDLAPIEPYGRPYWEFQAVVAGRIARLGAGGPDLLRRRHLWLSAPGDFHGWIGERGKPAEVVVFHFQSIPEPLSRLVPTGGRLEMPLRPGQDRRLRAQAAQLREDWRRPRPDMLLRHEAVLLDLSLMVYESVAEQIGTAGDRAHEQVRRALDWFAEHLEEGPGLEEAARAAGASVAHLRRLFHGVMRASPKQVFDQIRFQRAMHLMADPAVTLAAVSEACGFQSPSAFSRAFKLKFGVSPARWRGDSVARVNHAE